MRDSDGTCHYLVNRGDTGALYVVIGNGGECLYEAWERGVLSSNTCRNPAMSPDSVSRQILMRIYRCVKEHFYS